jgi:hypothetical protein
LSQFCRTTMNHSFMFLPLLSASPQSLAQLQNW